MTHSIFLALSAIATVAATLVAGIFMAFSDFAMKSLGSAQPKSGLEVMQIINRDVYHSTFIVLLIGTAPFGIALAIAGYLLLPGAATAWLAAGAIIYVVGVIFVTLRRNVPMNIKLDLLDAATQEAETYWQHYLKVWTFWNHVRTFGSLITGIFFLMACITL